MTTTDQPAGEPDTEGSYGASTNFAADFSSLTANIATGIKGKSTVIHLMALALIADGHVLVEDVPGVGKTSLGKALARSVDGRFDLVGRFALRFDGRFGCVGYGDRFGGRFGCACLFHVCPLS